MNNKKVKGIEIDLFAILEMFWRKKYIIILSCIVGAAIFLFRAMVLVTPLYTSYATMYANNSKTSDENTSISSQDISASARLVNTYQAIILSDPVLEQVIDELNLNMSPAGLAGHITVTAVNKTEVFRVDVKTNSPKMSAAIANSIARVAPEKIASIVDGCSVKIISYAKVPTGRSWPNYKNEVITGAALGTGISLLAIFIIMTVDTRIKKEEDLAHWEYPILGVIPSFSTDQKGGAYAYSAKGGQK